MSGSEMLLVSYFGTPTMYPFITLFCICTVQVLCTLGKKTRFSNGNRNKEVWTNLSISLSWFCV